ncbi:MAG: histidine kinase [Chitinophagaceae bacterium]|nr:histidine kinase [Chitinophagaceae bacterium]
MATAVFAQNKNQPHNLLFYQLNIEQGLSDNYVTSICTDKNSNLWIGTNEGLNRFNGKTVTRFFKDGFPQLANNNISELICDNNNRIWVRCDDGFVTLIDENRKFYKVSLYADDKILPVRRILNTGGQGLVLFTKKGFFTFPANKEIKGKDSLTLPDFSLINIPGADSLITKSNIQVEKFDNNSFAFSVRDDLYVIHFKEKKITGNYHCPGATVLGQWQQGELLLYDNAAKEIKSINLGTREISYPLRSINDQYGQPIAQRIVAAELLDKDNLLLASLRDGLYLFNITGKKLTQYLHRAGDPSTLLNNRPSVIYKSNEGWVFIGSRHNGICYFKTDAVIRQQTFFADKAGSSYDGYINSIIQKNKEEYYIGGSTSLLRWNRNTNQSTFVNYAVIDGKPVANEEGASLLAFDKMGRLWFLTSTMGIAVIDKNEKLVKQFPFDTINKNGLMATWAEHITNGDDGWMWIGTHNGLRRINPSTFEIDDLRNTPLHQLKGISVLDIFFNDPGYIWIATGGRGLWKYNKTAGTVQQFTTKEGLPGNHVSCVNKDNANNIYAGTSKGLQIFFADGKTKTITAKEGLVNSRVNILMPDAKGRMWMSNITGIACYNPADASLKYFDQGYGLSIEEIRKWAYFRAGDDELFWGTEKGIQYFYPDDLYNYKQVLKAAISGFESENLKEELTQSHSFRLRSSDNNITFHFNTIEYLPQLRIFYQYKLEGQDKEWIQVINENSVRYNSLAPGKYVFKVRASNDNRNWVNADNEISIYIPPPFYKTWWFRLLAAIAAAGSIFYFIRRREEGIKKKESEKTEIEKLKAVNYRYQLEIENVTGFFGATIHQHDNTDELLWDVAKNLIGKLEFEDCMIYLWDLGKTLLLQKAGYGIKGSMQAKMDKNKYHVPKGKGIVGASVESKRPLLINDTSKDNRYFAADDKIRLSELCVPIIKNDEAIGAINTEHSEKGFYTERHLQILTTIASMLADKIDKIEAQQQGREKEMEVLKLNKDLATSQLTTLRAQMNPHFIFNALNSVQQYILQGNVVEANKYLSKFSKLQREVLNHSDQDFISLEKELEVLTLYLELEQLRFDGNFNYEIKTDPAIDDDEIKIPPMIVQPFVENSIWHGLMPKQGERWVRIHFELSSDDLLLCTVTDNGIGRDASARLKQNGHGQHKSKGLSLVYDRLNILRQQYGQAFEVKIKDITDSNNVPAGTEVKLHIYTG